MPEHARVAIYEDEPFCLIEIKNLLDKGGHEVVAAARNYEEAEVLTAQVAAGKIRLYAVCMDGNLGRSHGDGEYFAAQLQNAGVHVISIAYLQAPWADYSCPKGNDAMKNLSSLIDRL